MSAVFEITRRRTISSRERNYMKHARAMTVAILLGIFGLPLAMAQKNEIRDFPPDFHQYIREALPEDIVPGGELALPPEILGMGGLANGILIKDVVISNTDKNLKNTNRASNSEPSIAINPTNPKEIDILAFTAGWGTDAPIWHSTNAGNIWSLDSTIPNPTGLTETGCPCDQTPDYGRHNRLSATFLDLDRLGIDAYSGTTTDPTSAAAWKWFVKNGVAQPTDQVGQGGTDQPWLLVNQDPKVQSQDDVYVAYDNFDGAPDMRIAVAPGSDPPDFTIDSLAGFSQGEVNPGQRLAVDRTSAAIYTLFQQCPTTVSNCNNIAADPKTIHWFLNRSTDGGHSTQPQPKFGTVNALLGGVNHIAVDPNNGDVYVVFGNRDPNTTMNRLSIVRLTSDGKGGLKIGKPHFVTGQVQAALPSMAIAKNSKGTIGILYIVYDGLDQKTGFPTYTANLAISDNHGVSFTTHKLEKFLSPAKDDGDQRQRVLGDYEQLKALGSTFYGVFPGNGVPFGRPFANIDPIFFKT